MTDHPAVAITLIIVLGVGAQWLSWRLRQPSILLLLVLGLLAGPVTGLLEPDALLGDLLTPLVSLAVALILFEGGLSLHLKEIRGLRGVLARIVFLGGAVTLVVTAAAAHLLLDLPLGLAALLGAVLVVSGPTVIVPILRHVRPDRQVASLLKWEAMVIDPVGVLAAVLIFEALLAVDLRQATAVVVLGLLKTLVAGGVVGALAGAALLFTLARDWVPDYLHSPVTLMVVLAAFTGADAIQEESGLVAVTLMGAFLANQGQVAIRHVVEFKENLRVLLLACLFVLLAARIELDALSRYGWRTAALLVVLLLVARPLSILVATIGTSVPWSQRAYLAWMHPRGVVAASVSAIFALRLEQEGHPEAAALVPVTFLVIVGTIIAHGLPAGALACALRIARPNPQGLLFLGAAPWARAVASALQEVGVRVVLADASARAVAFARRRGLPAWQGDVLMEHAADEMDLEGVGRVLAVTSNEEVNSLAALHFMEVVGRGSVYQIATAAAEAEAERPRHLRGRLLWGPEVTSELLTELHDAGAAVRRWPVPAGFDLEAFREEHAGRAVPLFLLAAGQVQVLTARNPPAVQAGQTLVCLAAKDVVAPGVAARVETGTEPAEPGADAAESPS